MKITKAVIPAAGFGTRFLPFTRAVPKEMIPLVDKPVIQYVVEEAAAAGITDILIVVSAGKEAIQEHFIPAGPLEARLAEKDKTAELEQLKAIDRLARIHYVYQQELNGLGDAVAQAAGFVGNDPFAVLLGDTVLDSQVKPVTAQLCDAFARVQSPVVALEEVPAEKVSRYGIAGLAESDGALHRLATLVEKPSPETAPSRLAIASRYVFTPDIFAELEHTPRGKGGEIQLTDAMKSLLAKRPMYGLQFDGKRYDIGNKLEFLKSTVEFGLRRPEFRDAFAAYLREIVKD